MITSDLCQIRQDRHFPVTPKAQPGMYTVDYLARSHRDYTRSHHTTRKFGPGAACRVAACSHRPTQLIPTLQPRFITHCQECCSHSKLQGPADTHLQLGDGIHGLGFRSSRCIDSLLAATASPTRIGSCSWRIVSIATSSF